MSAKSKVSWIHSFFPLVLSSKVQSRISGLRGGLIGVRVPGLRVLEA